MFRRAVSAVVLLIGVRTAFLYLSVLSPKYWYRVIGTEAHVGWLNVINPTIIIIGLIAMIMVKKLRNVDTYKALTYGALVAALCFVPLSVPWYFVSANIVFAYYAMAFASLIILSFGEMFWSPRLSAYILSCATPEQKGMYASFASIPWILANTIAGGFSGIMLLKWAPSTRMWNGAEVPLQTVLATKELPYWQTPEAMWFVLGVIAIVGPIVMLVPKIKKWFTEPEYRFFEPRLAKFITALLFARISTLGYGTREMIFLDRRPQISEVK
jgi:hypothetical protein